MSRKLTSAGTKWLQYYLPVALCLFLTITTERTVVTDGGYDKLYGLPLPSSSNAFACSFCYEVYVGALLLNLTSYLFAVWLGFYLLQKVGMKLPTSRPFLLLGSLVSILCIAIFLLSNAESFWALTNKTSFQLVRQELIFKI